MKRSLVEFLRDPVNQEPFTLVGEQPATGEVMSGKLQSASGQKYDIIDGVPNLVRADQFAEGQKETVETFSWKWDKAKSYRTATLGHYRQWYLDRYGFGTEEKLAAFLKDKRRILDAGTAHGRDAELYHNNSTAQVYGVDISSGIRNAYRDLQKLDRLNLVQGDLARLPYPDGFFDFIGCDQVIHHTPNTRESLNRLLKKLAVGGHVSFYVYKKKG
ncbi:MAG TPA: class I SAM-dependent methyltransferase, partial [Polyangiaceae bacterium]|nr:class I SAM-dependent methyltransferase [Polyangiaceae bacterium]